LNKKTIKREKEEGKEEEEERREARIGEGTGGGGDVIGHEVSLVTTATDERRAHP